MQFSRSGFRRLGASQRGATAVEYGLIAALIVIVAIGGITALGGGLSTQWNSVNNNIN